MQKLMLIILITSANFICSMKNSNSSRQLSKKEAQDYNDCGYKCFHKYPSNDPSFFSFVAMCKQRCLIATLKKYRIENDEATKLWINTIKKEEQAAWEKETESWV